jgi:hypothetical protein
MSVFAQILVSIACMVVIRKIDGLGFSILALCLAAIGSIYMVGK